MPKTTEHNLIVCIGKAEAEVTDNKKNKKLSYHREAERCLVLLGTLVSRRRLL